MRHTTKAFTLIELLVVIVIMGIIGGMTINVVQQYYEGIYRTSIYAKRGAEADRILGQMTKYFENAIDYSIVNLDRNKADGSLIGQCNGRPGQTDNGDFTVAFVMVDVDSLRTSGNPGWSENVLPAPFLGTTLTSNDANFTNANNVITSLYPESNLNNSVIYNHQGATYGCSSFNWNNDGDRSAYFTITNVVDNTLTLTDNSNEPSFDNDRKYLIRTGYAFRVLNDGRFMMYNNFRPWRGERYTTATRQNVLAENVAHFYADTTELQGEQGEVGLLWRLKVCMRGLDENLSDSENEANTICREKRVHVRY